MKRTDDMLNYANDPIFKEEQSHLCQVYHTLLEMEAPLRERLEQNREQAAEDKKRMADEIAANFASWGEAQETWIEYASANSVVDAYNQNEQNYAEKLSDIHLLLKQPYFAKVCLKFPRSGEVKEIYLGNAGISDDNYQRLIVDWRSPVAEVYYNQDMGPTSYRANGKTIEVDLLLRRQFDIEANKLNAYFDTTVAIQDSLLLASLAQRRSDHMRAITATIQREQNQVIRHDDVPALLVSGIAGSGKTSVLLQRIAYLFYQQREKLQANEVCLITPNPLFRRYIDQVLPDLGEENPEIFTWKELATQLMPPGRSDGSYQVSLQDLYRIEAQLEALEFEQADFKELAFESKSVISINQIKSVCAKYKHIPAGPHRVALMRDELEQRFESFLAQQARTEATLDELSALSLDDQLKLFGESLEDSNEERLAQLALKYIKEKYASIRTELMRDAWLRIDRIGMRLAGKESLDPTEWIFTKILVCGMHNPAIKYVMIDEVQDYTIAQLLVVVRYFRRANIMLLGDENQAIREHTASFAEIRALFERERDSVDECRLMTSYRSTPEITSLFASLLPREEHVQISSVLREDTAPDIRSFSSHDEYIHSLKKELAAARTANELTALILPWKDYAKKLQQLVAEELPLVDSHHYLPSSGLVVLTLSLAKGLEFDHVIIPDATDYVFKDNDLSRKRLYTTISRATRKITILAPGELTSLLQNQKR